MAVLSVTTQGSVVTVNLNEAFGEITGTNTELAVAQVVATVAAESGRTTGVIFQIEGEQTSVPVASGAQVPGPVYVSQFIPGRRQPSARSADVLDRASSTPRGERPTRDARGRSTRASPVRRRGR